MMRIPQIIAIFAAMMREVFDESAYQRFLERNHLASSVTAYAEFLREYEATKVRRPRCC
jgi:hypothetical protein